MVDPDAAASPSGTSHDYEPAGFFLLRAPVLPVQAFLDLTGEPLGGAAEQPGSGWAALRQAGRARLLELARDPRVVHAVHAASASAAHGLERLTAAGPEVVHTPDRRSARSFSTLLRYSTRMATRPTPYGLFAAVALGTFGETTTARLAADPVLRTRTRADLAWLLEVIKLLEERAELRHELPTAVNALLYRVGDRVVLPVTDVHGQSDARSAGLRLTAPVAAALRLAATPGTRYADLVAAVATSVPGASQEKAEVLLASLWDLHVLTSGLRPASASPLPELDLLARLTSVRGAEDAQAGLRSVREGADTVDAARGRAPLGLLHDLERSQLTLTPKHVGPTSQVDSALALEAAAVVRTVGDAAAEAADLLVRLGAGPSRPPHLRDYHDAFLERYGVHAEVPLLEVLSPESGLDAPPTYTAPPRASPLPMSEREDRSELDRELAALAVEALHQDLDEVELTDARLARLLVGRPAEDRPRLRPSLDLYAQVAARSRAALDAGDWRLVVTPGGMTDGGRTLGRFFDVLDEEDMPLLRQLAAAEDALTPDLLPAELSYLPTLGRGGNVATRPVLRDHEICLNTAASLPDASQVRLADILLGATDSRFYLRSAIDGRELVVRQGHLLTAVNAPNVCRLLLEVSEDGRAPLTGFDWGPAGGSPVLPRVTRGRLVLAPRQWVLDAPRLGVAVDGTAEDAAVAAALAEWRRTWRVPRHVFLVVFDNRLLLDLDHPLCVDELLAELHRARSSHHAKGRVLLHEVLPALDETWLRQPSGAGHVAELVVPLVARDPDAVRHHAVPARPGRPAPTLLDGRAPSTVVRRVLSGGQWTYLKLYSAPSQHEDLVGRLLPDLVTPLRANGLLEQWFFIRYADPFPHVRVRLHAAAPDRADALTVTALQWARGLASRGLLSDVVLASYDREVDRYGGEAAFEHLERVFCANSEVTARLVAAARTGLAGLDADIVPVLAMHTLSRQWGVDPLRPVMADRKPSARPAVPDAVRAHFRKVSRVLCDLVAPWDEHPVPAARELLPHLGQVFAGQAPAVAEAGDVVRRLATTGELVGEESSILASVLHMQMNRLLGTDVDRERRCRQLWQLAVATVRQRPGHGVPRGSG